MSPARLDATVSTELPVNDLAAEYQPRRFWAAVATIAANLIAAALFLYTGAAGRLLNAIAPFPWPDQLKAFYVGPLYATCLFFLYSLLNFPIELCLGYLEERQFVLAKDGVRAWCRDWLIASAQHGLMFITGCCLLLLLQLIAPATWLMWASAGLLILFLGTTWLAADLLPVGLFQLIPASDETLDRLRSIAALPEGSQLPPVIIFTAHDLRDYSGGLLGLGRRQAFFISQAALALASDNLLRFVMLHDLGHRRYHHPLLSTLAAWAVVCGGLAASDAAIFTFVPAHLQPHMGSAIYLAWLAFFFTLWMVITQPILAYFGRRLEYQADRFFLRHGSFEQMKSALAELSERNLARTDRLQRRQSAFHPLPTVANRLHRAKIYAGLKTSTGSEP